MPTSAIRESAKIYQFPLRGRTTQGPFRGKDATVVAMREAPLAIDACDGWYHEAALRDADRTRKS